MSTNINEGSAAKIDQAVETIQSVLRNVSDTFTEEEVMLFVYRLQKVFQQEGLV